MENEKQMNPEISFDEYGGSTVCATTEEQREEATARLMTLVNVAGMDPKVLEDWKKNRLHYTCVGLGRSVALCRFYKTRNMYDEVRAFEKKYGAIFYYAIENGGIMQYFFVSKEKDRWEMERLEAGRYIEVYGFDWRDPEWGEYGQVEIASKEGIVYSIDLCEQTAQ